MNPDGVTLSNEILQKRSRRNDLGEVVELAAYRRLKVNILNNILLHIKFTQ